MIQVSVMSQRVIIEWLLCCLIVPAGFGEAATVSTDDVQKTPVAKKVLKPVTQPVKGVVSGVKDVGGGAKELVEQTVEETKSGKPVVGTVKGLQKGTEAAIDSTIKGAYKAATLGLNELEPGQLEREAPTPPS